MIKPSSFSVTIFSLLAVTSNAFLEGSSRKVALIRKSNLPLNVGMALDWKNDDDVMMMERAQDCSITGSCSLDEARYYLNDVIRIQSACASGKLMGSFVCEDQDIAADIVANLRERIKKESQQISAVTSARAISMVLAFTVLTAITMTATYPQPDIAPFTPQEWWWSIRDGYFPTMLSHYFVHGGLATADFDETSRLTLQEWWWSINGGYFPTMLGHFFRHGGLATLDYEQDISPITLQEWIWALQGGYFGQILEYNLKNGGIACESDALSITPREFVMAAQNGYLGNMATHFFRNAGL